MNAISVGIIIPFIGTIIGSSFVFFMKKEIPEKMQKALLGFASGVMIAASIWSLLIPSMEMTGGNGLKSILPTAIGFLSGIGFLLLIDEVTPHIHPISTKSEGIKSKLSKTAKLALSMTIHNLPEGMAVGVVLASQESSTLTISSAIAVSIGIAIQNIPEGAIVAMPMRAAGNSRIRSFTIGSLSGVVEPIGTIAIILLASSLTSALPFLLAFSAGSMMYVVVEELIPEASQGKHTNISTIGFSLGFVLMMILDVVLG